MTAGGDVRGLARALGHGERVFLRYPEAGDVRELLALRRASRRFHAPWEPTPPPGVDPYGRRAFAAYLASALGERSRRTLVCDLERGRILGAAHLNEIVRGPFQSAFLSYWVGVQHAGRGYMTEGVALLVDHAFGDVGLHRLEANIRPENEPSRALVRRLGFRCTGTSPRYLKIRGRWRDHQHWEVLAEEWRALRRRRGGRRRRG